MMVLTELSDLSPIEQIKRYLQLANDAIEEAETRNERVRESYLVMARHWENLAVITALTAIGNDAQPQERVRTV